MSVEWIVVEVTRYQLTRREDRGSCGSTEPFHDFADRERAERMAARFNELEREYEARSSS